MKSSYIALLTGLLVGLFAQSLVAAPGLPLSDIPIRDPFILADKESGTYFLYASDREGDGVKAYQSKDLKSWTGPTPVFKRPADFWGGQEIWAPEVHKLDGHYYLFVTFNGREFDGRNGRGTAIFRAANPLGPFEIFSPEATTPARQQCLDGTPWVDGSGQNWMVYCEEWGRIQDGAIRAMRMAKDWSRPEGESVVLFHASQAPWVHPVSPGNYVTDGPFLYEGADGVLRMIWSTFSKETKGYAVGLLESKSGKVEGPWMHFEKPIFQDDGGHGMIFRDFDGHLLLVLHAPNGGNERARLFLLDDKAGLKIRSPRS